MDKLILLKPLMYTGIYFGWAIKLFILKWFIKKLIKKGAFSLFKTTLGIIFFVFFVGTFVIVPFLRLLEPIMNDLIKIPLVQGLVAIYFFIHGSIIFKGLFNEVIALVFKENQKEVPNKKNNEETIFFEASKPIFISNIFRGLLISGGAGSGKSASFIYPLLNQMIAKRFTGIVYDYKNPELIDFLRRCAVYHSYPYKLISIDFKTPESSSRVNLLKGLSKIAEVKELSSSLWKNLNKSAIKDGGSFWNSSAENVLTATFFTLIKKFPDQATIPHALAILLSYSLDELIQFLSLDNQARGLVTQLINGYELGASNQTAGVISTLTNYVSILNSPENFWVLSGLESPIPNSSEEPSILMLGNDSTLSDSITPILAMICTVTIMCMNKPNQLKSMVVIDELPTIFLPTLKQLPAVARSNKIATCVTVQDKAQLEDTYGQKETEVILSNLGSQFFGRSTLETTNRYISNLFGKHDVNYKSKSVSQSGGLKRMSSSTSTSYSVQERNRLQPQQISNFKPGEFAGIIAEGTPNEFVSNQVYMYDTSALYQVQLSEETVASSEKVENNFNKIYSEVELLKSNFNQKAV